MDSRFQFLSCAAARVRARAARRIPAHLLNANPFLTDG
jgi:hypothetical protein